MWKLIPANLKITDDSAEPQTQEEPAAAMPSSEEPKPMVSDERENDSIASLMHGVGVEVVSVPLDRETLNAMKSCSALAGIDVTTAFILFAKASSQEGKLALAIQGDSNGGIGASE